MNLGRPLDEHADGLSAGGAGGDDAELAVLLLQAVGRVHQQADAGRAERMADAQGA